jgi:hypothetical protein
MTQDNINEIKDCFRCCRKVITKAITCEDGLDGAEGEVVIKGINRLLKKINRWSK